MFRVTKIIMLSLLFSSIAFDCRGRGRDYQPVVQYMPEQPCYIAPLYSVGYPGQLSYGKLRLNYQQINLVKIGNIANVNIVGKIEAMIS